MIFACSNNKITYWCGDHPCINKKEKEAYFKKTMTVEMKILDKKEKNNNSDIEEVLKQARLNEEKRIKNEKLTAKQLKIDKKNKIKEEKRLARQAKIEEKRRIKEEKKLAKQIKKNKKIMEKDIKTGELVTESTQSVEIGSKSTVIEIDTAKFDDLVDKIIKRNSTRPFPDINDIPN